MWRKRLLADGKAPDALVIELSAHRQATFPGLADDGMLVRANHFLDSELDLTRGNASASLEKTWSEERMARSSAQLQVNSGWIGVDKAAAFLRSDRNVLLAASRHRGLLALSPDTVCGVFSVRISLGHG